MFVHLHVHTQYSLLQGAIHVDSLFERVKELSMPAVAITDTHNLFGAIDFYQTAKKAGVKPIIGCEILYAPLGRLQAGSSTAPGGLSPRFHHLVLLCKNYAGYQNLCKMVTRAYLDAPPAEKGGPTGPRALVDRELLDKYGDELVVLSGCIRGEIPYKILSGNEEGAIESLLWFKKRFSEDFFIELQDNSMPEQEHVNEKLYQLGQRHGISVVATTDCHYLHAKECEAHEVLQCIEGGRNLDFDRPKSLVPAEYYLKSAEEMRTRFERFTGACDNTLVIADRCNVEFKFKDDKGRPIYHLPLFRPEGVTKSDPFDLLAYFREQTRQGLRERFESAGFKTKVSAPGWPEKKLEYEARLEDELAMIERTGFAGYFLIVADFIIWAKKNGIPVGPGRGSGAGSLVAYSLKITDIDPIQFNLLFERFINPERISMPDFDVDFCQERRGLVIDYVTQKYGSDNVCQIITFGKLQARAVLKDVGRVLGFSFAESDQLTKLMPDELNITISDALQKEVRLRDKIEQEPKTAKVVEYALSLEGLYRNAGIHAAGVIITEEPVVNYCPLYVGRDGDVVTQFDKDSAEKIGLVKFDFLGLKTLTVIDLAVQLVREGADPNFDLEQMNYEDPKVFALIASGDTDGVFQVESSGMKDLCIRIQPSSLEDITAINALYRPGPLGSGMVDDFIDRKHGRKPIVYDVDTLAPILKDTYGVILYQEQVMQIARELAGYSLGQADILRRAMGKKKAEEMAEQRAIFVRGAVDKGILPAKAEGIFDLMAKFAEYGFNKSHSAAYGVITYQTAYLKTYFPAEFMAGLMTTEMDNTDKITKYIADARAHRIPVLPPDVNHSQRRFSVEAGAIRFGLEAIKGVGGIAVDLIIEARRDQEKGAFKTALDFCQRVSVRKVNKKVMESLTLAGAFDEIAEVNRASLFASLEGLIDHAGDQQAERELGQSSLFDSFSAEEIKLVTPLTAVFKQEEDWPRARKLALEKQVVGFYVSGHPMDSWQKICEGWLGWSVEKIYLRAQQKAAARAAAPAAPSQGGEFVPRQYRPARPEIKLAGLFSEMREVMTKKGGRMAFGQLEDLTGKIEVVFFPEAFTAAQELLKRSMAEAEPLLLVGELEIGEETPKIFVKTIEWLADAHRGQVHQIILKIDAKKVSEGQLRDVKKGLIAHRGKCPVRMEFIDSRFRTRLDLPQTVRVAATPEMIDCMTQILGPGNVVLQ